MCRILMENAFETFTCTFNPFHAAFKIPCLNMLAHLIRIYFVFAISKRDISSHLSSAKTNYSRFFSNINYVTMEIH
jgi:hypothetical protein